MSLDSPLPRFPRAPETVRPAGRARAEAALKMAHLLSAFSVSQERRHGGSHHSAGAGA